MGRLRLFSWCAALAGLAHAHDIITTNLSYARDIAPIFANRCIACHAAGSAIPLTSYAEVRPWAVGIKEQVLSRAMPPWGAIKGFGDFSPDGALTEEEIMIIAAWVVGGAPEGPANSQLQSSPTVAAQPLPKMRDALVVTTSAKLDRMRKVAGIRALENTIINSVRVIALLPDGRVRPLIWFYNFDSKSNHTFHFREPVELPAGTRIESSAPLRFALEAELSDGEARR